MNKFEKFALAMSEQLFTMRVEDLVNMILFADSDDSEQIPVDFVDSILDEDVHIAAIKERIRAELLEQVQQCPNYFMQKHMGQGDTQTSEYVYSSVVYDYAYMVDVYIKERYEEEEKQNLIRLVMENYYGEDDHTSRSPTYKNRRMYLKSKTNDELEAMLTECTGVDEPKVNLVVDKVLEELKQDFARNDYTRLEVLLHMIPREKLITF